MAVVLFAGAVTVGNFVNARGFYCRLKTGFVSNLHFLECIKHPRTASPVAHIAEVS